MWYDSYIAIPAICLIMPFNFKVDNLENKIFVWSYLDDLQTTRIVRFLGRINAFILLSYVPPQISEQHERYYIMIEQYII